MAEIVLKGNSKLDWVRIPTPLQQLMKVMRRDVRNCDFCGSSPHIAPVLFWGAVNKRVECDCGTFGECHAWDEGAVRLWNEKQYTPAQPSNNTEDGK